MVEKLKEDIKEFCELQNKDNKKEEKEIIADLHIHSKYSRACSKNLDFPNLVKWAKVKGLNLLGTGDFTHPIWLQEIRKNLKEKNGLFYYEDFPFMLTGEISLIYTQNAKGRRVHLVILVPSLEVADRINAYLDTKGRRDYDGRPIFKISCEEFTRELTTINKDIEIIPAHAWTPWFGIFGSMGGFNSLKEAFGSQFENIHAIETGMSSDPEMNWRIMELHGKSIVSFSDSHSFWPWRLGREATIFTGDLNYINIINQIRNTSFKATIETEPAYGKYHFDGHRLCNFSCSPAKTRELGGICPVCGKNLTIGVEYRVEQLKDNKFNIPPKNAKLFYKILPLHELIAFSINSKVESKKTWAIYNQLIEKFGNEFNILLYLDKNIIMNELGKMKMETLAKLITDNRVANLKIEPGYDGTYGKIILKESQKTLI